MRQNLLLQRIERIRRDGRGNDSVPDHGLGLWGIGVGVVGGGVARVDVDEELLCVPVVERGEVCVEVEADLGVFFALGGVVVWSSFDAVRWTVR